MTENQVLLSLAGYNQIKAENQKFRMFMERMWENSSLSADKATVEFDPSVLTEIMHLVYPEELYIKAFQRMLVRRRSKGKNDKTGKWYDGEAVFRWWTKDYSEIEGQMSIFDMEVEE